MPEFQPTRPVAKPVSPIETLTLEGLAAQVASLQAQVAGLLAQTRAWNDAASAVTELQSQVAPLVGHTHQIAEYQYTAVTTVGENLAAETTVWTIPAISAVVTAAVGLDPVEIPKPVQSGPPVAPAIGF